MMEISNTANQYQAMHIYQKPEHSIQPVPNPEPSEPVEELTPEEEMDARYEDQAAQDLEDAQTQAKQDAQREYAAGYVAHQSKQSQVEIYLAVATDSDVSLGNNTASIIESLRDVQKQNNRVEAYAIYQENQNNTQPELY
ncbi:MAG: hypothetical protein U9R50_06270 [Campylobacterota bacterium]|nr:hypothetical protein [Campylobacterota bacterium]